MICEDQREKKKKKREEIDLIESELSADFGIVNCDDLCKCLFTVLVCSLSEMRGREEDCKIKRKRNKKRRKEKERDSG